MKKCILDIVVEREMLLTTRERLEKMFGMIAECHVTIGGSYALKYWCDAFSEREVSDYDFIIHALPENIQKIETFLDMMNGTTGWLGCPKYYDYKSFYFGTTNKLKINIILKPGNDYHCVGFESLKDVITVKKAWCEKAIEQGKEPRHKDVEDIATYEKWEQDHNLPF